MGATDKKQKANPIPKGFISEHTAEFVLVSEAVDAFAALCSKVIPISFWASREGRAKVSSERMCFRVVSVFARRPKVISSADQVVIVKINRALFEYAAAAEQFGIPTLAASPLVASLDRLHIGCESVWFRLCDNGEREDFCLEVPLEKSRLQAAKRENVSGPSEIKEISRRVADSAERLSWQEVVRRLRELKNAAGPSGFMFGPATYKPFHLLLVD